MSSLRVYSSLKLLVLIISFLMVLRFPSLAAQLPHPVVIVDGMNLVLEEDHLIEFTGADTLHYSSFRIDSLIRTTGLNLDQTYHTDPIWMIFSIRNPYSESRELVIRFTNDHAKLIAIDSVDQSKVITSGIYPAPYELSSMQQLKPVFDQASMHVSIGANETQIFALWAGGTALVGAKGSIEILDDQTYVARVHDLNRTHHFQLVLNGMFLLLAVFNFLIFLGNRDKTYLFYCLYVLAIGSYFLSSYGLDRLLLSPNSSFSLLKLNIDCYGIIIFYPLFCWYFLHKNGWKPGIRKAYQILSVASSIFCLVSSLFLIFIPSWRYEGAFYLNMIYTPIAIVAMGIFIYTFFTYIFSKRILARYIGWGASVMVLFGLLQITNAMLTSFGILEEGFLNTLDYVSWLQIACFIEAFVFALALSYRSRKIEMESKALAEIDQTKTRFFSNISHEFKTPLTLILGPAHELMQKVSDAASKKLLTNISHNANRLLGLINEILDLSKIEAGHLKLNDSAVELNQFVRIILEQFRSFAESKNQHLTFDCDFENAWVYLDKDKLEKVMVNIISNACKYTPERGEIQVHLSSDKSHIQFEIIDTGIGIAKEDVPKVFDRFFHTTSVLDNNQTSTGIGLALTKELVELMGGSITLASEEQVGTQVFVRLPFVPIKPETDDGKRMIEPTHADNGEGPTVLIIEDNHELRSFIKSCFSNDIYIIEAADGAEGLTQALTHVPDLIITDVMMPKKNGLEVCRAVKSNHATNHIPVLVLTGKSSQRSRIEGLEANADAYLSKPFDPNELRLTVRNLLATKEQLRKHYSQTLMLEASKVEVDSRQEVFIKQAIEAVEKNISNDDFTVEDLSDQVAMDRTQLFRKLKALTGHSPSVFIRNIRLRRARQLLESDAASISEVAYSVGFNSPSYFIKCYKELYGFSPGDAIKKEVEK